MTFFHPQVVSGASLQIALQHSPYIPYSLYCIVFGSLKTNVFLTNYVYPFWALISTSVKMWDGWSSWRVSRSAFLWLIFIFGELFVLMVKWTERTDLTPCRLLCQSGLKTGSLPVRLGKLLLHSTMVLLLTITINYLAKVLFFFACYCPSFLSFCHLLFFSSHFSSFIWSPYDFH